MAAGVLVVDHDDVLLRLLQTVLSRKGIEADVARTAQDAMQRVSAHSYQVVISDWHFPESGGADLLDQLRAHPDRPVIILTIGAEIETSPETADIISLVVKKPYDPLALSEVIASCVSAIATAPASQTLDTSTH